MISDKRVIDMCPSIGELDVLEVRLHELDSVVDQFIVLEAVETYGGNKRTPTPAVVFWERFSKFSHKLRYFTLAQLSPPCTDRVSGRAREAYQRDYMLNLLKKYEPALDDYVIFSDLDEIPRAGAVEAHVRMGRKGVWRFSQTSYYYNVNTVVDVGHDWASRARIGTFKDVLDSAGLYEFRMTNKNTEKFVIHDGGWHFGYFGGVEAIIRKVATMSSFLQEYKLFGEDALRQDIRDGRDLHHRKCELPERFAEVPSVGLPAYVHEHLDRKLAHFTKEGCLR